MSPQQAPAGKLPRWMDAVPPPLPIFRIIGRALAFEATHLFTLFRLTWLPLALLLAVQVAVGQFIVQTTGATSMDAFDRTPESRMLLWLGLLLQALPLTAVATSVHRLVYFGDTRPGVYFAFRFGATELRYLVACVAIIALAVFPTAAAFAIVYLTKATWFGGGLVVVAVANLVFFFFITLRLLILPPMTVATERLSVRDAFLLSEGHVVSLFALIVLASVAIVAGVLAVASFVGFDDAGVYYTLIERPDLFGWVWLPNWDRFMQPPTAEMIAAEFGLSFVTSTFIVACLSYAYLAMRDLQGAGEASSDDVSEQT
jgi:hypothetical protein